MCGEFSRSIEMLLAIVLKQQEFSHHLVLHKCIHFNRLVWVCYNFVRKMVLRTYKQHIREY